MLRLLLSIVAMLRLGKCRRASLLVAELSLHIPDSLIEGKIFLQACRDVKLGKVNRLPKAQFMDLIGQAYLFAQEIVPSVRVPEDVILPANKRGRMVSIGHSFDKLAILNNETDLTKLRIVHALAYDDVYALKMIKSLEVIRDSDTTLRYQPVILSSCYIPEALISTFAVDLGMQLVLNRYVLITRAPILTSNIRDYFRRSDIPEGFLPVGKAQRIEAGEYGILCLPAAVVRDTSVRIGKWSVV